MRASLSVSMQEKIEDIEKEVGMKHEQILELSQNVLELETHNSKCQDYMELFCGQDRLISV